MLTRPLAPFRCRPIRKPPVPKALGLETIGDLGKTAEPAALDVKSLRARGRAIKASPDRLRVLKPLSPNA